MHRIAIERRRTALQGPAHIGGALILFVLMLIVAALSAGLARGQEAAGVQATPVAAKPAMRLDDVGRGELLFKDETAGALIVAPLLLTEVDMDVSGMVNRVVVRQHFLNPEENWVEGVYVFPLPEDSAVDHLRMQIGDRFINGVIKPKQEARETYEAAKEEGKAASLLEQSRPNIFTTSVANIGPGETIVVEIEYQQTLAYESGAFSLRFPMVVGPRYIPGDSDVVVANFGATGWAAPTDRVPDADRITPPVLHPSAGKINPVRLTVDLDAGFPLAEIASVTHAIDVATLDDGRTRVTLQEDAVPADKDFELVWTPAVGSAPGAGLFTEILDGEPYALIMVMPPNIPVADRPVPPREIIFIIDTSGSMEGTSIVQAKAAMQLALDRLTPADRFNVIRFSDDTSQLFVEPRAATPQQIARAKGFVDGLIADGGTEMLPAIQTALGNTRADGLVRQVIFLTDGAIGNETELFEAIRARLGDRRLFTVGIGSAPNSYFMRKAAEFGRGTFTYIDDVGEVTREMGKLFVKLEQPVVTDIALAWPDGVTAETAPDPVPDLYQGEPVVITAKLSALEGALGLKGRQGGSDWILTLPLTGGADHDGVAGLWARRKIDDLTDGMYSHDDWEAAEAEITRLALRHHLVSEFTSLVAIDVTPRRPADETVETREMPTNLPAGWDFDAVFGTDEERAQGKAKFMQAAHNPAPPPAQFEAMPLGVGATSAQLQVLTGLLALLLAALLLLYRRRVTP